MIKVAIICVMLTGCAQKQTPDNCYYQDSKSYCFPSLV